MGSKSYSATTISDYRQAAEGEIVSGVQSQLALPGGVALGEGATLSITGSTPLDAGQTFEKVLSNVDSTVGKLIGLSGQLAQGLFEQTPAGQATIAGSQQASITGDNKTILILAGVVLVFLVFGGK